MDEVFTCHFCGCQKWIIHDEFIECGKCSKQYYLRVVIITGAKEFNDRHKKTYQDREQNKEYGNEGR